VGCSEDGRAEETEQSALHRHRLPFNTGSAEAPGGLVLDGSEIDDYIVFPKILVDDIYFPLVSLESYDTRELDVTSECGMVDRRTSSWRG
jgi:hypothetical protein